jgi:hypothetical protein
MATHQACRGRYRHPDEILAPRPSRIARLGIVADVEAGQARDPADKKQETNEGARLLQVLAQLRVHGIGEEMESPDKRQQARSHAKGNGVG